MKYILIDTANMFFRARHGAFRASDTWEKIGFALHITLWLLTKWLVDLKQIMCYSP